MNGEGLVVPVLFRAEDIDVRVYTSFRHGWEIWPEDLRGPGLADLIVVANEGGGDVVRWIRKEGEAQVRKVRNRHTGSNEGAH